MTNAASIDVLNKKGGGGIEPITRSNAHKDKERENLNIF